MKNIIFILPALFCLLFSYPVSAENLDETQTRNYIRQLTWANFANAEFDKLEDTAASYRTTKEKTPSGQWKLAIFHQALKELYSSKEYLSFVTGRADSVGKSLFIFNTERLNQWAKTYPESVIEPIVRSSILNAIGAEWRGTEYSYKVKPENMAQYIKYLNLADETLDANKERSSIDPHWYADKLFYATRIQMEQEDFDALLLEAAKRHPDYLYIYFMANDYYSPKYGGNAEGLEKHALKSEDLASADIKKSIYTRVYWSAAGGEYGYKLFEKTLAQWPKMKAGFDDILANYPVSWNWSHYLQFSCLANDRETAEMLLANKKKFNVIETNDLPSTFDACKKWARPSRK